jgi:hypothetical protein
MTLRTMFPAIHMSRSLRLEFEDVFYHVMNRGRGRQAIFHSQEYYLLFWTAQLKGRPQSLSPLIFRSWLIRSIMRTPRSSGYAAVMRVYPTARQFFIGRKDQLILVK